METEIETPQDKRPALRCNGFTFSAADIKRMDAACDSAEHFMRSYGKSTYPGGHMPIVNYRHYFMNPVYAAFKDQQP